MHCLSGRISALQPARDLLWRPVALKLEDNSLPQLAIEHQLAGLEAQGMFPGALVCQHSPVPTHPTVTLDLQADRRRGLFSAQAIALIK